MEDDDPVALLFAGRFVDVDTGLAVEPPTREVHIEESLEGREVELITRLDLGDHLVVVADPDTRRVLGERVIGALRRAAKVTEVQLDAHPHADMATAAEIARRAESADALIAVGSGTINDLCKYASAQLGVPYVVFATAPSMNGYLSANAAITDKGHKKSLPAHVPAAALFDLRVLSEAPARMIHSGLGDSLCRATAQSDWLLAHYLRNVPYRQAPFDLLAADEEHLFAEAEALVRGGIDAMRSLVRTLVLSGAGMTLCGSSQPASQGEHLISHYIDMMAPAERGEHLHGVQVGVTTLTMARLQDSLLNGPPPVVSETKPERDDVIAHFGAETGEACWQEFTKKRLTSREVDGFNERIAARWDDLRAAIEPIWRSPRELAGILERAGASTTPESIEASKTFYRNAVTHARELRNRYTFLDLAGDAGRLGAAFGGEPRA